MANSFRLRTLPALGAALLAAGLAPAHADTRAELNLSNFGYSLVDLAPEDGVAPGVTFFTGRFATNTGAGTSQRQLGPDGGPVGPIGNQVSDLWNGAGLFFPSDSRAAAQSTTQASLAVGGNVGAHGYGATAQAHAASARNDGLYDNNAGFSIEAAWPSYTPLDERVMVVLAPNTALVWRGDLSLEVEKDRRSPELRRERSFVQATMRIWDRYDEQLASWSAGLDTKDRAPGLVREQFDLSLTWANATDQAAEGQILFYMLGNASSSVGPVPEPGTLGLMLAGLGVVAVGARRRARERDGYQAAA